MTTQVTNFALTAAWFFFRLHSVRKREVSVFETYRCGSITRIRDGFDSLVEFDSTIRFHPTETGEYVTLAFLSRFLEGQILEDTNDNNH